jgi:hypothetical protein
MRHERYRIAVLSVIATCVGWIGWSGNVLALPVAVLFPVLWSLAATRWQAAAVSAGYFLAASRGLPQGVANFYSSDIWPGLALWLIASTAFVLVHSASWAARAGWQMSLRYLMASVAMAIPPFGITGWAHPVAAAGVLFPGSGWWGLLAVTAGLALLTTRLWPAVAIALTGFWLRSAACWTPPLVASLFHGVDLEMGETLGRSNNLEYHRALASTVLGDRAAGQAVVVLPESALGFWTPTVKRFWQSMLAGTQITVVAGAALVDEGGYDNVLVKISPDDSHILYRERMPVPGSMWLPWSNLAGGAGGARAHFFANPVVNVSGTKVAPLICYEQLVVWPIVQSMIYDPDIILIVGNAWWTSGTSIAEIQRSNAQAWARLFDVPLVMSFNY